MNKQVHIRKDQYRSFNYHWEGVDQNGKHVSGEEISNSITVLKNDLYQRGISILKIHRKKKLNWYLHKISHKDLTIITRQLATLLQAGIPLTQALTIIIRAQRNLCVKDLLETIKQTITEGSSVTDALAQQPLYFNSLYRNLIFVGERSGALDVMFEKIADHQEKSDLLHSKIKKALFYPISVLIIAIIITVSMLIFVVPQFQTLFANFGAELPVATRIIIIVASFLQNYGCLLLFGLVLLVLGIIITKRRSSKFHMILDRLILQIPILSAIIRNGIIARFARTLALTFASGIPLIDALQITAGVGNNQVYLLAILQVRSLLITGHTLQDSLAQEKLFPPVMIQMVAAGEESGTLEKMLRKIAEVHEKGLDAIVENLTNLLEPLIMIILGLVIGSLVIAMYLPLFKLGSIM